MSALGDRLRSEAAISARPGQMKSLEEIADMVDILWIDSERGRTCSNCGDTVPLGWTLDDHFNCNFPEDFEGIATSSSSVPGSDG